MRKKSQSASMLVWILFLTASFIVITGSIYKYFGKAEDVTAEIICSGSIAAGERATIKKVGLEFKTTPLLCKTIDKRLPETKDKTKEGVKKEFADAIAKCWWMMGEGYLKNVFDTAFTVASAERCFICYTIKIGDLKEEKITREEMIVYMDNNVYLAKQQTDSCSINDGGVCIPKECSCGKECNEYEKYDEIEEYKDRWPDYLRSGNCEKFKDKGRTKCCYNKENLCVDKGGRCKASCEEDEVIIKNLYSGCENNGKCCIKRDDVVTYTDYIQFYGGEGYLNIDNSVEFNDKGLYTITFYSHTERDWFPDWLTNKNHIYVSDLDKVANDCVKDTGGQ